METIGDNLIQVKKERSYISCLVNGWSYGFKHLGMLLRYMWPSIVMSMLLPFTIFFFYIQLDALLHKWIELGYLPNATLKSMRQEMQKCAPRTALTIFFGILFIPVVAAGLYCLLLPFILGWKYLWGVLIFLIVFILLFPMTVVEMQIRFSYAPLKECFRSGFRLSFKNFGSLFAFLTLENLVCLIVVFLGSIPYLVMFAVSLQVYNGMQMGDVVDVPVWQFILLVLLSACILSFVFQIALIVLNFSHCLMWGSLVNEVPAETEANS